MRYYSNSEFQTFKDCRRKWWLGWHRGLRPLRESRVSAAATGLLVHEALAPMYVPEGQDPADPREVLEELIRAERGRVTEAWADDPQGASAELTELSKQHELVRAMIHGYVEWVAETGADSSFSVVGSERALQLEVTPGRVLVGRLDVQVARLQDGVRLVMDHKTCQSFVDLQRSLQTTEQIPTYLLLDNYDAHQTGDRVQGALYNGLRKVKRTAKANPPFYERFERVCNAYELESQWLKVQGNMRSIDEVAARIDGGEDHRFAAPPHPTKDCHWKCEFYAVCPMFDDGSRAEDMLAQHYVTVDPNDRYPELSGTKEVEAL